MITSYLRIKSNDYYSCDLTSKIKVTVTIKAINGDTGLGFVTAKDNREIENYVKRLQESEDIITVNVTHRDDGIYWTEVTQKSIDPGIYSTVLKNNSMSELPIIIEDGWQYHKILSPNAKSFQKVLSELENNFTTVELLRSSNYPDYRSTDLTDKQREILEVAFSNGYYELPRAITIQEMGEKLGIHRSSAQERLHRAEKTVMTYFYHDHKFN